MEGVKSKSFRGLILLVFGCGPVYNQPICGPANPESSRRRTKGTDDPRCTKEFEELLNVGIALSSVHDLEKLLDTILLEARRLTQADGGTLCLANGDRLIFRVSQCRSLSDSPDEARTRKLYQSFELPVSRESIAGYSAGFAGGEFDFV